MDDFDAYTTHKYEPYKAPQPAQQDIPDLIAGALGVSRGTAYDMMREALAEQPAPAQPLTDEQIEEIAARTLFPIEFARAIEAEITKGGGV